MDQKTADQSKDTSTMCFTFIMKDSNHECIEATAGGTTKGGLESADIWGDADDVSCYSLTTRKLS